MLISLLNTLLKGSRNVFNLRNSVLSKSHKLNGLKYNSYFPLQMQLNEYAQLVILETILRRIMMRRI